MKLKHKKGLPIFIATLVFSAATVVFAVMSIINTDNLPIRIATQASLCLTMLFNGVNTLMNQKQKALAFLTFGIAAFIFVVMIYTIFAG